MHYFYFSCYAFYLCFKQFFFILYPAANCSSLFIKLLPKVHNFKPLCYYLRHYRSDKNFPLSFTKGFIQTFPSKTSFSSVKFSHTWRQQFHRCCQCCPLTIQSIATFFCNLAADYLCNGIVLEEEREIASAEWQMKTRSLFNTQKLWYIKVVAQYIVSQSLLLLRANRRIPSNLNMFKLVSKVSFSFSITQA